MEIINSLRKHCKIGPEEPQGECPITCNYVQLLQFCVMKRESDRKGDRKCVNRTHAQSFDRCELMTSITWPYCGLKFRAYQGHMF